MHTIQAVYLLHKVRTSLSFCTSVSNNHPVSFTSISHPKIHFFATPSKIIGYKNNLRLYFWSYFLLHTELTVVSFMNYEDFTPITWPTWFIWRKNNLSLSFIDMSFSHFGLFFCTLHLALLTLLTHQSALTCWFTDADAWCWLLCVFTMTNMKIRKKS